MLFILIASSLTLAQKDFSIYPLTPQLEFGTKLPPLFNEKGYGLEFPNLQDLDSPQPSMQYVYPEQGILYSMRFVEPDPTKKYSMYTPEAPDVTLQIIPEANPLEH